MRTFFKTNPLTKWSGILILLVVCINVFESKKWEDPNAVIASDVKGYYGYLPALFINDDIKMNDLQPYVIDGDVKIWLSRTEDGQQFIKFPTGMAIMYSPFFAVAHLTAQWSGDPTNGYSEPYRKALVIGSLIYVLFGITFFAKLLLHHFNDRTTATTLIVVYLATNLYYYSAVDGVLTHGYSFFLFSAFMYGCVRWIEHQNWKHVFLLGITGGLMVAVRHIDLWFLLFILLYGIRSIEDIRERLQLLWNYRWQTLAGLGLIGLMLTPQLLYHWYLFGNIFHYSYSDERFFFGAPHLLDSVFSYRNGWLVYTPIMIFAVVGIFFLRKRLPRLFLVSVISLPVYYYVLASWWCWWFVGFGNRAYINMYPLLAFSLAAFIGYLYEKQRNLWRVFNVAVIGAIVLNTFQSKQFNLGILHWDSETREHYWYVFGHSQYRQTQEVYLETPDNKAAKRDMDSVFVLTFDTLSVQHIGFEKEHRKLPDFKGETSRRFAFHGKYGLFVPVNSEFAVQMPFEVKDGTSHIYISAWVKGDDDYHLTINTPENVTPYNHMSKEVVETRGDWKKVHVLGYLPKDSDYSELQFFVWNQHYAPFAIDQIEISCLRAEMDHRPL